MARLFGTDGVRGVANSGLDCNLAMKIGAAGAHLISRSNGAGRRVLVGCDTRKSGDMLCAALMAGICSVGCYPVSVGVIPTPAMAYLVRKYSADSAVMISASHNTMEYNGIKWFNGGGYKLTDSMEDEIEAIIREGRPIPSPTGSLVGKITVEDGARDDYISFLKSTACPEGYKGIRIALDCANGSSSGIARELFESLGAEVSTCADAPDGCNINDGCGSTHPELIQRLTLKSGADAGFAFDGDADRVIACDDMGRIVNGDKLMGICAANMKKRGALKNNTVVITVMSNIGLKKRFEELNINYVETDVGDRYVLEAMLGGNYALGGEQSGHVIFLDRNTTGDGMLTAVQALNVLASSGAKMSDLADEVPSYPQVLVNVGVNGDRNALMADSLLCGCVKEASERLGDEGRILLRPSGTEPLLRIMIEGKRKEEIGELAMDIAGILVKHHGGIIM